MNQTLEMPALYKRLLNLGFTQQFIREKALPCWWDKTLETNPVAVTEAAGYIAKRLGLDISTVLNPDVPIVFKKLGSPKFKRRSTTDEPSLIIAQGMATRVVEMITYSFKPEFVALPQKASEIRDQILKEHPSVDLDGLLKFCGTHGVPVIHFSSFPPNTSKMDGMAVLLNGRPAIVITVSRQYSAWLLFIAAHELGHLVKGHANGGILVDEEIHNSQDIEETEANEFSSELLLGCPNRYTWSQDLEPTKLAAIALSVAERDKVDPGAIVLNYAWTRNQWAVAMKALEMIEPEADAPTKINRYLINHLDWDRLDIDSQDYLTIVTGA